MHKVIIVLCVLILAGCGDQRILEELGFIHTSSYDLVEQKDTNNEMLLVTVAIPKANREGKIQRETLTATAKTVKEARFKFSRQTELALVSGQLRNTLFGMELAKKGIWKHIDTIFRDPAFSQRVKLTIVDGNAHDLLVKEYPQHPRTGQYIERMLEKEVKNQTVPYITLYQFTRDLFDDGIDPIMPLVKQLKDNVEINGIALFNEDKYVSKIEPDKVLIFSMIRDSFKQGEISIDLGGNENEEPNHVMFSSIKSSRKLKVLKNNTEGIHVQLDVKIQGSVMEYLGNLELSEEKDRTKLEALVSAYLEKEAEKMIGIMQQNHADSIGVGKVVRNSMSYKEWKQLDWEQMYPKIKVTCHAKVIMRDYGKSK
jgi:spore germination protein